MEAVIFDLDGTLYDYESCNAVATTAVLRAISKVFSVKERAAEAAYAAAREQINQSLYGTAASHNRLLYMQLVCERLGQNPALEPLRLYELYWNSMLENMKLYPYVIPLFDYLKEKSVKIAVLTDLTAQIQHRKLLHLGLAGYLDALVTSEETGVEKPDERAFVTILRKLHVSAENALMVGDSTDRDIAGARRVGLRAVHFQRSAEPDGESMDGEQLMEFVRREVEK